jgi:hypothetical protein
MKTKVVRRSWKMLLLSFFLGCVVSAGISSAATIDFGVVAGLGDDIGGIDYDQQLGLVGNLEVDLVSYGSNVLLLPDGVLNFQMDAVPGYSTPFDTWIFPSGGSITITASGYSAPLMDGSWLGATLAKILTLPGGDHVLVLYGSFVDQKNERMLYDLEVAGYGNNDALVGQFTGATALSLVVGPFTADGFGDLEVASGDIINRPVPIPGAVVLLGAGLLGLIGIRRRLSR